MNVELIYDADCPNVPQTRSLLIKAFTRTGVSARWREWDRAAAESPDYARFYGSPTILVDGEDITGTGPVSGTGACPSCEVEILDMHLPEVTKKAKHYGIRSVPAVVVDGKLADCCAGRGPDEKQLRAAGVGIPL